VEVHSDILSERGMMGPRPASVFMEQKLKLSTDSNKPIEDASFYH